MIARRYSNGTDGTSSSCMETAIFLTMGLLVSSFALPIVLARAAVMTEQPGQPKKFEDELQGLLDVNSCQTLQELATLLAVDLSTVGKRLKTMGMIQKQVKTSLGTLKWDVLPHPPYSPDIAPSDYHLFRSMAHGLTDQKFTSYEDCQKWVDLWISSKDKEFFQRGIRLLPERWQKVVESDGKYFE
ncbi:Mariner Mos1 transposase [Eumeta japonica]|uniref:Mariner Mos1 transposase n=1 Tax=Eumeta variegata TaxID=151549 RepID=A0A4C2A847_EUMVA|nr:Mariner Mos1 transposase [Eumeta japonica]